MVQHLPTSEERLLLIPQDTEVDESLQVLIHKGWPEHKSNVPRIISPCFNMRDKMLVQYGLIFKGERAVVQRASRSELLRRI